MSLVITAAETAEFRLDIMLAATCSPAVFTLNGFDVAVLIEVVTIPRAARLLPSGCPFSKNEKTKRRKSADKKEPVKDQPKRQERRQC